MSEWISVKDSLPKDGEFVIYSGSSYSRASVGRYCGPNDPMPSAPMWLQWNDVKWWMPLPELPRNKK